MACAQRELLTGMGGFLELPGDHLRSDLTGLSLQLSDEEVGRWPLQAIRSHGSAAINLLGSFQAKATYPELMANLGAGLGAVLVGGLVVLVVCGTLGGARPNFALGDLADRSSSRPQPPGAELLRRRLEELLASGGVVPVAPSPTPRTKRPRRYYEP